MVIVVAQMVLNQVTVMITFSVGNMYISLLKLAKWVKPQEPFLLYFSIFYGSGMQYVQICSRVLSSIFRDELKEFSIASDVQRDSLRPQWTTAKKEMTYSWHWVVFFLFIIIIFACVCCLVVILSLYHKVTSTLIGFHMTFSEPVM